MAAWAAIIAAWVAAACLQLVDNISDVFFGSVHGDTQVAAIILFESPFPMSLSTSRKRWNTSLGKTNRVRILKKDPSILA
jgi:hypothetical protein